MESVTSVIPPVDTGRHIHDLTCGQLDFKQKVSAWVTSSRTTLIVLSGGPGTGKTVAVLRALSALPPNKRQLRMSFTARAAQAIYGRTLHSTVQLDWSPESVFRQLEKQLEKESDPAACIEQSRDILDEFQYRGAFPDVVVVDEISMIPAWMLYWLIRYFLDDEKTPRLFIVMGDKNQLRPVRSHHNLFSMNLFDLRDRYVTHEIHLVENKRFTSEYKRRIDRLREYVDAEDATGLFTYVCSQFPIVPQIDMTHLRTATRAMAFRNGTVEEYNYLYIKKLLAVDEKPTRLSALQDGEMCFTKYMDVKKNCLLFVNENHCGGGVNGTLVRFDHYNSELDVVEVWDDNGTRFQLRRGREGKFPVDIGFAGTVHKFQGETIDTEIVINLDGSQNLNLVYTALSRVRDMSQIVALKL